jgi:CBS domain-containing protein
MQVAELLRAKGTEVATVAPTDSVGDVVEVLRNRRIGAVVVSTDGKNVDGIASERDIVRALDRSASGLLDRPISDIMTARVTTCAPSDRVDDLMSLMTDRRIRHLPVVTDGVLAGIVSIGDVVKHRVAELEHEARALTEYIQHGR